MGDFKKLDLQHTESQTYLILSLTTMPSSWTLNSANEEEEPKAIFVRPCGKAFKFFLHSSLTQGHRAQMKTLIKVGEFIMLTHHQLT
jgi:hypothetical protein